MISPIALACPTLNPHTLRYEMHDDVTAARSSASSASGGLCRSPFTKRKWRKPNSTQAMTSVTNTKHHHRIARHTLRRRIADAAVKRFVANAQRALPRDGPREVRRARRLVATLARQERARGGQKPQPASLIRSLPLHAPHIVSQYSNTTIS